MKKVAVLYSNLSGYTAACQRALKERAPAELLVVHWPIAVEAPFSQDVFGHIDHRYSRDQLDAKGISKLLDDFQPDVLLISGWMDKAYLAAARHQKDKGVKVVAGSDTQWTGNLRQRVAQFLAPWYLHRSIDVLWVTGERQRYLANQLGFQGEKCWMGYYACDWQKFAIAPSTERTKAFLYTGRYQERKGIHTLLEAYQLYRSEVEEPWDLWTAGTGPLANSIQQIPGTKDWGFVQPADLPKIMSQASAFILPSQYEPWGVALHEAATASLPLLASHACGAGVHLLRDGFNGFSFEVGNSRQLASLMRRFSDSSAEELEALGKGSFELSKQYTPELWADTLIKNMEWA